MVSSRGVAEALRTPSGEQGELKWGQARTHRAQGCGGADEKQGGRDTP